MLSTLNSTSEVRCRSYPGQGRPARKNPFSSFGLVFMMLFAVPLEAAIINVPADFPTIQAAVDASVDLDEIVVAAGVYHENIIFNGKRVTVCSSDPTDPSIVASTVIDGGANGPTVTIFDGENRDAVLDGLTIRNGSSQFVHGAGVYIVNTRPVIRRCVIENNAAA